MKSLFIAGLLAAVATGAFAQGQLDEANNGGAASNVSHIYGPETQDPTLRLTGNVSTAYVSSGTAANHAGEFPTGTQAYNGGLVGGNTSGSGTYQQANGTVYSVELSAAPGDNASSLTLIPLSLGPMESAFSTKGGTGNAGFFNLGAGTIPNTSAGGSATVQVFAWFNNGGTWAYSDAVDNGAPAGFSDPFNVDGLGVGNIVPPELTGLTSFNLTQTPEPSTMALGLIGACLFLLRRRK